MARIANEATANGTQRNRIRTVLELRVEVQQRTIGYINLNSFLSESRLEAFREDPQSFISWLEERGAQLSVVVPTEQLEGSID